MSATSDDQALKDVSQWVGNSSNGTVSGMASALLNPGGEGFSTPWNGEDAKVRQVVTGPRTWIQSLGPGTRPRGRTPDPGLQREVQDQAQTGRRFPVDVLRRFWD